MRRIPAWTVAIWARQAATTCLVSLSSPGRGQRIIVAEPGGREERLEPVEIRLADRVELVIVAAGAADRQAEEDQARRLGDVVQGVLPPQTLVVQVDHIRIAAIEAGRDEGVGIVGRDLVAGQLEPDELIVRQVTVQGAHDPVAVSPGVRPRLVELEAIGVGITRQVEPVLRPALAVLRAGQQAVDDLLISIRRAIVLEASISSGVGGRPVRSKLRRRSSVGAIGFGRSARPLDSRTDRMNASMGLRTHRLSSTTGGSVRRGDRNAQWSCSSAVIGLSGSRRVVGHRQGHESQDDRHRAARTTEHGSHPHQ